MCSSEITFKTDPKNSDYECEAGATRNFEAWRDNENEKEATEKAREEEERLDSMKSLENRTIDSKLEMDVLDALDEIKAINQRHERVDTTKLLNIQKARADAFDQLLSKSDDEIIASAQFKSKPGAGAGAGAVGTLSDSDDDKAAGGKREDAASQLLDQLAKAKEGKTSSSIVAPAISFKKKRKVESGAEESEGGRGAGAGAGSKPVSAKVSSAGTGTGTGLLSSMLASYGSDESD